MGKWENKKVGECILQIQTGKTPPKNNKEYYENPTIDWFSPSDFDDDIKELSNSKNKISNKAILENKAKIYPINSLLLVGIGATIGKVAILRYPASSNQQITCLTFNKKLDINFAYYWFRNLKNHIIHNSSSATLPIINQKDIKLLPIRYPHSLPEQQQIVAKLDALFAKIDRAIALLEENIAHTQALMGSVLDEELSKYETKTEKIKNVLNEINSGFACNKSNETPNGYVHLRTHNIDTSGNLNFDLIIKIDPSKVDGRKNQLKKGDILFNNTNSKELVGKTALVEQDYNYGYSNHLTRIRLNKNLILSEFFVNYMINLHSQGYFLQICKKWIGQAGVNTTMLKEIEIKFPSIENQINLNKKIQAVRKNCSLLISKLNQKIDNLKSLKSSFLDQAFRGEL